MINIVCHITNPTQKYAKFRIKNLVGENNKRKKNKTTKKRRGTNPKKRKKLNTRY